MSRVKVVRLDIPDEPGYTQGISLEDAIGNMVNGLVLQGGNTVKVKPLKDGMRGVTMTVTHKQMANKVRWEISEVG